MVLSLLFGIGLATALAAQDEAPIDVARGRELMQRAQRGEALSPEEQAYLERVRREIRRRAGQTPPASGASVQSRVDVSDLVPLTELTGTYKGEEGGLYGGGRNDPPAAHWAAYLRETEKIVPLDAAGRPSESGTIGLISIGFSNTSLEFAAFKQAADVDPHKSPRVVLVNGAMGMRAAVMWAYDGADLLAKGEQERLDREMDVLRMPKANRRNSPVGGGKDTWPTLDLRLKQAGVSPAQVQVVWLKHVEAGPAALGGFPDHAKALQADMADILVIARKRFPNLRVAYLSSRTYAGWAGPNCGSPEPYAHESAFAVRWLVQSQISGEPQLNYDPARGEVRAPIALWGPYLWARGDRPRQLDGLIWSAGDVRSDDHMHPSEAGCGKIAALLLNFLKTDAGARRWFLSPAALAEDPPPQDLKALLGATGQGAAAVPAPTRNAPIDVERAKRLMQRSQAGETLSAEDEAYLRRVRQEVARRQAPQQQPVERDPSVNRPEMVNALVPLTELTGTYNGESGGLYGDERNDPPPAHLAAAMHAAAQVRPLDADGNPAEDGRIVLLSLGLSNTTMEYSLFKTIADADPQKSPRVVVVDGAQGGRPSFTWAASGASFLPPEEVQRLDKAFEVVGLPGLRNHPSEWVEVERRLTAAGVTPKQVQVVWLKQTFPLPGRFGEFPSHARSLQADLADIAIVAKSLYPNLRLLYLSSRTFGGYAFDAKNPEPYAYESAFAVRWVIQEQISGDPRLNHDAERGAVTAPVLLWGPYLWANGTKPRQSDGLVWEKTDVSERDGMHPSPSGCRKVAEMLLRFFKTDETAKTWF